MIERDPAYGLISLEFTQNWLRGIYEDACKVPDQSKLERSTRQMARAGRLLVPPYMRESSSHQLAQLALAHREHAVIEHAHAGDGAAERVRGEGAGVGLDFG